MTYNFTWTLNNAGCGDFSNDLVVIEILPGAETAFAGNEPGAYTFTWTVDAGICGTSSDEVVITYGIAPEAEADQAITEFGQAVSISVVDNDITPEDMLLREPMNLFI